MMATPPNGSAPEAATPSRASRWLAAGGPARWVGVGGLLLALAVLLAAAALLAQSWAARFDAERERLRLLARVLEDHATRSIDTALLALRPVGDLAQAQAPAEVMNALLAQTQASLPQLRSVALLDDQGRVLASSDAAERGARIQLSRLGRPPPPGQEGVGGFVPARTLGELSAEGAGAGPVPVPPGVGFVPLWRSERGNDGRVWLLLALLSVDAMGNFHESTLNDAHAAASLVRYDGQVLSATSQARLPPGGRLDPGSKFLQALQGGAEHGSWNGPGLRLQAQLGAFRALRARPLAVVLEVDREAVVSAWMHQAQWSLALALAVATVLAVLSLVASRLLRLRRRAERALHDARQTVAERERELSAIFGSVQSLLFRTDRNGCIQFINERYEQLWGRSTESARGEPLALLFDEGSEAVAHDPLEHLFDAPAPAAGHAAGWQPRHVRARLTRPGEATREFDLTLVPLLQPGAPDGLAGWVGSAVDVSELLQAQSQLHAQLAFARSLLANSPLPTSVLDPQGCYVDVNHAWELFTGRSRAQVLGQPASSLQSSDDAQMHSAYDRALLVEGGQRRYEARWRVADGTLRDLFVSKSTFENSQGQPAGVVVSFMDITDFRAADQATRAARDAAVAASQAKSEFIANMSHELRTPLQSILGFSELGLMRSGAQPKLAAMFGDVHRAGQRMLVLVNDLLDLSKIESNALHLEPAPLDLRRVVEEVAAELRPQLAARRIELVRRVSAEPVAARADDQRLQQVVRNVLANAIKFSPEGACVEVDCQALADGGAEVVVADRGPGIPAAELESVFEAFVQSTRTNDGSGGTGLGLAICRRIMQGHAGSITAEQRPGGGSVFRIRLPAPSPTLAA